MIGNISFAPLLRPAKLGHEARARFEVHAHKLAVAPGIVVFWITSGNQFADVDFMREQRWKECRIRTRVDSMNELAHTPLPMLPRFGDFGVFRKHEIDKSKLVNYLLCKLCDTSILITVSCTPSLLARVPGRVSTRVAHTGY